MIPGSGSFYFSAPNWDIQGFIFRSAKIQCTRVWLNCLKLGFLCLGARIPKKVCSESLSVTFRRTLSLTMIFQNKMLPWTEIKQPGFFLSAISSSTLTISSLVFLVCICGCAKEDTQLHLSIFSKWAQQESQTTCVFWSYSENAAEAFLYLTNCSHSGQIWRASCVLLVSYMLPDLLLGLDSALDRIYSIC